ncbi:MAG: hypothetical protein KF862_05280 [Chitinophagaceae bacterium]|nr:hypothetical protein [Chitinophagaceae bacterium]
MIRYLIVTGLVFTLQSCVPGFSEEKEKISALNNMLQADVDFSNRSKEAGMRKAFLEFIDDEGILLRGGRMPIIGADAVDFIASVNDSAFTLTWSPEGGDISGAYDMGYTYGIYQMQIGDSTHKGTYVTIWKKQAGGEWKFVLDSGNAGVEPADSSALTE